MTDKDAAADKVGGGEIAGASAVSHVDEDLDGDGETDVSETVRVRDDEGAGSGP